MKARFPRVLLSLQILFLSLLCQGTASAQGVDLGLESLGRSPFSQMSTLFEKGILFIRANVLKVDVRFGPETEAELERLAFGREPSTEVLDSLAQAALRSRNALIELTFLRDVPLDRFIAEARNSTERVWKADLISKSAFQRISRGLPYWYTSLREKGIRNGDKLYYRIRGDQLHTVFEDSGGTIFVDHLDQVESSVIAVLGGYFADKSDFRDGLVKSLFSPGVPSNAPSGLSP